MKDIIDAMTLKLPESINPVHFSNIASLNQELLKLIRIEVDSSELKRGLPLEALEKIRKANVENIENDKSTFSLREHFEENWSVYDPYSSSSKWLITKEWEMLQLNRCGSFIENDKKKDLGTLAISEKEITLPEKFRIITEIEMGKENEIGLVFNFKSSNDYWVLIYKYHEKWTPPSVLYLRHILAGTTIFEKVYPTNSNTKLENLNQEKIILSIENDTDDENKVRFIIKWDSHEVEAFTEDDLIINRDGKVGFYSRYCDDAKYLSLNIELYEESDESHKLIEIFPDQPAKIVKHEYENEFTIDSIDMRPVYWIKQLKKIWAKRYMSKKRFDAAKKQYDNLFEIDTESQSGNVISPSQIENAESFLSKSFNEYLKADSELEELTTLLNSEGIEFKLEEKDHIDLLGDFDFSFSQQFIQEHIYTWKEFFIKYSVYFKGRGLVNEYYNRVRHSTFISTKMGLYIDDFYKCFVTEKNWKTAVKKETKLEKLNIRKAGNIFDQLNKIIGIGSDKEYEGYNKDIRQYNYINGEYIDQYGIAMQDYVIEITENPDELTENILVVPQIAQRGNGEIEKYLIIKNPVFSGKRIHPTSIHFEEKYMMDVKWNGVGLGEFSHSVNLFPGEERELQLVTSKKRAFETVSSAKSSRETKTGSESMLETKRNDTFSSKLQDSLENNNAFSSTSSNTTTKNADVKANGGFFGISMKASAGYSNTSNRSSNSSLSAVSKKASELASETSTEVSENNKVSFSSTTNLEQSLEEKVTGEDMESETTKINISNINEGKTVNYNFFQVTNMYSTHLSLEDATIHISSGIEIIPGTGITIDKSFEIQDFNQVHKYFSFLEPEQCSVLQKAVSAEVLKKYLVLDNNILDDEPQILCFQGEVTKTLMGDLKRMRNKMEYFEVDLDKMLEETEEGDLLPGMLDELVKYRFKVSPLKLKESNHYTVNSGKYYVEAQVGFKPATEEYLETRREIETDKQKALVEEIKVRTDKGVFFQDLPTSLTQLNLKTTKESDLEKNESDV